MTSTRHADADAPGTDADAVPAVQPGRDDATPVRARRVPADVPAPAGGGRRRRFGRRAERPAEARPAAVPAPVPAQPQFDIAPNDPLLAYAAGVAAPIDLTSLELESPAVEAMRAAGVVLVVPLISSGELIGLLNLGPRLSEQGYSSDDRRLLDALAGYAAPAMRVGQLVRAHEAEARNVERIQQELAVAQLIQQQFLPSDLPELPGWHVAAFYRPARVIGGDFYDFVELPDGRVMFICGDVTDKGVPAALVMASTHALLRETAPRLREPGEVLARVNDLLVADIPAHMFVTCLAMVMDPRTGEVVFANAGHNLPYVRTADGVRELRATGMPLGLMEGMSYEQRHTVLEPGECVLLHSDGLAEAHDERRAMFGFDRLAGLVAEAESGEALIDRCLEELARFTGPGVDQEDDITLVTLERSAATAPSFAKGAAVTGVGEQFSVPSEPGGERAVIDRLDPVLASWGLPTDRLDRLKTAVAETVMNAIEHGNHNNPRIPVEVAATCDGVAVEVTVSDRGGLRALPDDPEIPDLEAKLEGLQRPRGWGLFLVRNMVDDMAVVPDPADPARHTVRLRLALHDRADLPMTETP